MTKCTLGHVDERFLSASSVIGLSRTLLASFWKTFPHISTYCICSHLEYFSRIWFLGFCCVLFLVLLLKTAWRLWLSATCCPIPMSGFYRTILLLCTKTLKFLTSYTAMQCNNTFCTDEREPNTV